MRVDRCFAFVDLCGFTSFADHQGDERAVLVLAELRAALREISARRGVRVVKWLGDGAMLSSTMTDALVAAVIELRARLEASGGRLSLRAGIDAGPVIMFEGDDYIGRSVNVASRLCDVAAPGTVLATEAALAGLPPWVRCQGTDLRSLRGFDSSLRVVELWLADPGADPVADPVCGLVLPLELTAAGAEGERRFCSEACAGSWVVAARQPER